MIFKTSPVRWPRVDDLLPFSSNFLQSYKPLANTDDGIEGSRENEINQSFFHLIYRKCMHTYYLKSLATEMQLQGKFGFADHEATVLSKKKNQLFIAHKNLRTVLNLLNYNYSYKHQILKRRLFFKKKHLRTIQTMPLGYEGKSL